MFPCVRACQAGDYNEYKSDIHYCPDIAFPFIWEPSCRGKVQSAGK